MVWRAAAREDPEFFGFQFEDYRPWHTRSLCERPTTAFRQVPDHRLGLCQQHILFKCILHRFRFRWPFGNYWTLIDTASWFMQSHAVTAKFVFKE